MQIAMQQLDEWIKLNSLKLNSKKTKEMILHFGRRFHTNAIPNIVASGEKIEKVNEFKLLGVIIRSDLSWCSHVKYIVSKASRRIFVLSTLIRSGVSTSDILAVYCSLVRSVLEYASTVWHCGLTKEQSSEIEKVQKRCLRLIFPNLSYSNALQLAGLERLTERRERAAHALFQEIKRPNHILHNLLQSKDKNETKINTRNQYPFRIPRPKTSRLSRSLIVYGLIKRW